MSDSVSEVGANAPWEARAPDLEINRLTLWPAELRKPDAYHPPQGTAITAMIPRLNFRALPAHFEVLQCPWLALQHCDIAAFASFRVSPSILMICHGASIGTRFGGGLVRLMYAMPCAPRTPCAPSRGAVSRI